MRAARPAVTPRHKTAVERVRLSRPAAFALRDGVISTDLTVLDYGCGRGGDVRRLRAVGVSAEGWDPFFTPGAALRAADVVTLAYVINVIEDAAERFDVLRRAFALARLVLVVGVRVECGIRDVPAARDGSWTGAGTFQKFFTQTEFLSVLATTLGVHPHSPGEGVAYVFKTEEAEARYLQVRKHPGTAASNVELLDSVLGGGRLREFAAFTRELGRLPHTEEWVRRLGLMPGETVETRAATECAISARGDHRLVEIAIFLALLRWFRIPPPNFRSLPVTMKRDIIETWGGYHSALRHARALADAAATAESILAIGAAEALAVTAHQ